MNRISVIGCNGNSISTDALRMLQSADVVFASKSLLDFPGLPGNVEKIVLNNNYIAAIPELKVKAKEKQVAILTSGDPLFYGVGVSLLRSLSIHQLCFYPAPTAFQTLFARLGRPWHAAEFFSVTSRSKLPFRAILRSELAVVFGDAGRSAQQLAVELLAAFPAAAGRKAAVGCMLGLVDEKILTGTLSQMARNGDANAPLSILALLPDSRGNQPAFPLGLPNEKYVHFKNMITNPEVRAVVLSKLQPGGGILWDVGAGSGSVGLEAAGLCPKLLVHSLEKNPDRFTQLCRNIDAEGLNNIIPHEGNAEELLEQLPPPNRIFIGGGGAELLTRCFELLLPGGRMVVTGVMVETIALLTSVLPEFRKELLSVSVSRAKDIASGGAMFWAENSIMVGVFVKPL